MREKGEGERQTEGQRETGRAESGEGRERRARDRERDTETPRARERPGQRASTNKHNLKRSFVSGWRRSGCVLHTGGQQAEHDSRGHDCDSS